jgi:DNA-binding beta-propeller fold protein YncE
VKSPLWKLASISLALAFSLACSSTPADTAGGGGGGGGGGAGTSGDTDFGSGGAGGVPTASTTEGGGATDSGEGGGVPTGGEPGEGGEAGEGTEDPGEGAGTGGYACEDGDGDKHGEGCVLGPDCDDTNPHFHDVCPDCSSANHAGCPCFSEGQTTFCYSADPSLDQVGECRIGQRSCASGYWTGCDGEVPPKTEVCDFLDNDCDGETDEGVLSACGNCDKFCDMDDHGPGTATPFAPTDANSEAVELSEEGWVTLTESSYSMNFIWIANSAENTVSKLDTTTGKELGRYKVCLDPSRTAVDKNGDAWIGCRSDGKVAKIINIPEDCIDKNGNGTIETSSDTNGDGTVDASEIVGDFGQDECIKFVTHPGTIRIRALGVDQENHAWIGDYDNSLLKRLHPDTGAEVKTVSIPVNPYGLAIDQSGIVWVSGRGGNKLVRVDPITSAVTALSPPSGCFEPYGIAVDAFGKVWIGNCCCTPHVAWRYDPASGAWTSVPVSNRPRGVATSQDGFVYVANDESNRIAKIDATTLQTVGYAELGSGKFPVGIAVDSTGYVWAVNQNGHSATKVDPQTLQPVLEQPVGVGPYTYSDMTGAFFFQNIAPDGWYSEIYGGWDGVRIQWQELDVEYTAPPGTWIDVQVRTADTLSDLAQASWSAPLGPFPPASFPVDLQKSMKKKGDFIEVKILLHTDSDELKPYVQGITLQYEAEPE